MPIEAVVFDMDGVLVDSEVYWLRARQEFARDIGKIWTDDDQRAAMGRNTIEWAQVMQERLQPEMTLDAIMDDIKARVIAQYEQQLPIRPGALEAVHTAASRYRIALASGSPKTIIQRVMQLTGLDKIFEFMLYGDDFPNGKPAPDVYLASLEALGVQANRAVGIEDSSNGVRALHNAGMYIIAAPSPGFILPPDVVALAHRVINTMEDFSVDLVEGIN